MLVPALSTFAVIGGKGHFRKILTQFFEFCCSPRYHALIFEKIIVQLHDPEFNTESIGTNFKSQKSKTKKLACPFYIGNYMAITSFTRQ